MTENELVTLKEAAEMLGLSWSTTHGWMLAGRLGAMIYPDGKQRPVYLLRSNVEFAKKTFPIIRRDRRAQGVIEDAEWLCETGEVGHVAYKRLGFKSWETFERMMWRWNRGDIIQRLVRNSHARGVSVRGKPLEEAA